MGDELLVTSDDFADSLSAASGSSAPVPQTDIEADLVRLCNLLEAHTDQLVKAAGDAAFYDAEYDIEYALAFDRQHGTVDQKKAKATMECADLLRKKARSAAVLKALREAGHNIRVQIDALRSINANHRAQVGPF